MLHQLHASFARFLVIFLAFCGTVFSQADDPILILNIAADALVDYLRLDQPIENVDNPTVITEALRGTVDQYETTNVTHLFFNVGYCRAAYQSSAWKTYWDDEQPESYLEGWPRKYWLIHQMNLDPFEIAIAQSHKKQISPWASIRMNDTHHLKDRSRVSELWWNHPELRTRETGGFDFTHPEVRQHYLTLIEELLQRYDVDGVELDWMRYADYFKPAEARENRQLLTDFVRKARDLANRASQKRGRPIGIAVRVPALPDFAIGFGLDAPTWAREGLVDIVTPCSTWVPSFPDVSVETWREAIGDTSFDYRLVPGTDLRVSAVPQQHFMMSDMETMRGFTTSMLDRGADGIYLFNHFARTDAKIWTAGENGERLSKNVLGDQLREAGSMPNSLGKPRRHILTFHDPVPSGLDYQRPLPQAITESAPASFSIHIGPKPEKGRVLIRAGFDEMPDFKTMNPKATLNGVDCSVPTDLPQPKGFRQANEGGWQPVLNVAEVAPRVVQFEAPLDSVRRGYNQVEISLSGGKDQTLIWLEISVSP